LQGRKYRARDEPRGQVDAQGRGETPKRAKILGAGGFNRIGQKKAMGKERHTDVVAGNVEDETLLKVTGIVHITIRRIC